MREIIESDLVGKTIKSITHTSVNVLKLSFTDGTELELWAESTHFERIPGIFVVE